MKTILSGIQPTGKLTLGNYLGAIQKFVEIQNNYALTTDEEVNIFIFIADLHSITVPQDPVELRKNIKSVLATYLACGLDPDKVSLFIQSEVKEHAELGYLMQTITHIGELERMTQFKDKMAKQVQGVSSALLTYPVLMAADILLYNADYVPVGEDQKQHLELTRNLAERFNTRFGDTFTIPEPLIAKFGAKIMSLQDPTKKMSKSDPIEKSCIYLTDPENIIRKKIASAVTDSEGTVKYDVENKPGISNLLTIASCVTNKPIKEIEAEFEGKGYGDFKKYVADALIAHLSPIQAKYQELINSSTLDEILDKGAEKATHFARKTLRKVRNKMGIGRKIR